MLKKVFKDKRAILIVSFLALFSLVLLAGFIGEGMTFRPPRQLSREESEKVSIPVGSIIEDIANVPLEKQIAFLVMLFLFSVLIVYLLPPEMRKRFLKQFIRFVLGGLLLVYLLKLKPDLFQGLFPLFNLATGEEKSSSPGVSPPPVFEPPQVSGWISYLITFGIILLVAFLFWQINRWWQLLKPMAKPPSPLDEIAEVARTSLRGLSSRHGSPQDRIIQCYADMSRVVDARRGLFREYAMTPAEFALRLENAGLPREPVSRLTRLFEAVRYGARISTQGDVDEAIACLTSILKYCGEVV
ncbi:MAG: DUF4129 domain-containing protein [Chloroflexi bacterium]|nr:DUF4129 domain-containing protein [Chloroflexota bacterium]